MIHWQFSEFIPGKRNCQAHISSGAIFGFLLFFLVLYPTIKVLRTQIPNSETAEIPNSETTEIPNSETAAIPNSETAAIPNSETAAIPNVETAEIAK